MILAQLGMIEMTIHRRTSKSRASAEPDRGTLRELLKFFTDRVGVHFKREAVLITALKLLTRKRKGCDQFRRLLLEHRAMKADAAGIVRKLDGNQLETPSSKVSESERRTLRTDLRTFIRRYRKHLSCEERILFVLADLRLTADQKLRVSRRMLQV